MDHLELVKALRARAEDPETRTDEGAPLPVAPVLSGAALDASIDRLGFRPPGLFLDLLGQVGNGGFGPGYGFVGLEGGETNEDEQTAVDLYCLFRAPAPDDPIWRWPERLLPFCNWGCAMYTCLDCSDEAMRLVHWDPNVWSPGVPAEDALFAMPDDLPAWLAAWARGDNLWDRLMGTETQS